jgi:FemAB-related protein (PEP-CTERM system-associated)
MNAPVVIETAVVRQADLRDPGECARIEAFVAAHPEGSVFHRPQWSRAIERGCGQRAYYLVAEQAGALVGCLPLTEIRSPLFGNAMVSVGFATGGGIVADGQAVIHRLADAGWALALERGCTSLELRGGPIPDGWTRCPHIYSNFARNLPADTEVVYLELPRRQRAEIRKGRELGLNVTFGRDEAHRSAHFRVYSEGVRNLGTPVFPKSLFACTLEEFGEEAEVLVAWKDGRPISTMLSLAYKGTLQPYWGGGVRDARSLRGNDVAWLELMRHAIERGFTRTDFGRSKVGTGPWTRKRIWEFEETPLVYAVRTADGAVPRVVNPLDPRYRLKIAAWQRLPLWLANRIGPFIARGLG